MRFIREDGMILEARNNLQASAFLNSGMKLYEELQKNQTYAETASGEKSKRGRKPKEV